MTGHALQLIRLREGCLVWFQAMMVKGMIFSAEFHFNHKCLSSVVLVCLFNRSVRVDTCMGPEGTKLKQKPEPGLKAYI